MATKKVNTAKLTELINSEVSKSLSEIKGKVKSTKKAEEKPKPEVDSKANEETKKPVAPKATTTKKVKETKAQSKKEAVTKEVTQINKTQLVEKVVSNREVKYIYPDDVNDTLSRKAWRQKVRNKLEKLERDMFRIKDQNSKEYKSAEKAYNEYRKTVLKEVG